MSESLKKKTVKGVAWTLLNQVINIGFGFVIGVILTLAYTNYGLLTMITVFNAVAMAFLASVFEDISFWGTNLLNYQYNISIL